MECSGHWIISLRSACKILHCGYSCNCGRTETTGLGSVLRSDERNDSVRSSNDHCRLRRFVDCGISFDAARKLVCEMLGWELSRPPMINLQLFSWFLTSTLALEKLVNFINQRKWRRSTFSVAVHPFTLKLCAIAGPVKQISLRILDYPLNCVFRQSAFSLIQLMHTIIKSQEC